MIARMPVQRKEQVARLCHGKAGHAVRHVPQLAIIRFGLEIWRIDRVRPSRRGIFRACRHRKRQDEQSESCERYQHNMLLANSIAVSGAPGGNGCWLLDTSGPWLKSS